jgi:hypothetical protein
LFEFEPLEVHRGFTISIKMRRINITAPPGTGPDILLLKIESDFTFGLFLAENQTYVLKSLMAPSGVNPEIWVS